MKGKTLKDLVLKSGKTKREWCSLSGIGERTMDNLYDKDVVPVKYVMLLKSAGLVGDDTKEIVGNNRNANCYMIPLKAFGGFLEGYKNKVYLDSLVKSYFPDIIGECYSFEVEGFSMYKHKLIDGDIYEVGYKPGGFVITTPVESLNDLVKGRDYVFVTTEGMQIKRFERIADSKCHLLSINNEYNPVSPLKLNTIKKIFYVQKRYT